MATIVVLLFILGFGSTLLLEYIKHEIKHNKNQNAY